MTYLCFYSDSVKILSPNSTIFTLVLSHAMATCLPCSFQILPSPTPTLQTTEPVGQSTTTHYCPTNPPIK